MRGLGAREYDEMHRALSESGEHWNTQDMQKSIMKLVNELQEHAGCVPNRRFLEFGCGSGCLSLELSKTGFDVTAVDISPVAVARAKQRFENSGASAKVFVADVAEDDALADLAGRFDYALDSLLLHNLVGRARASFFTTAYRALLPGGKLLIMTMCGTPKDPALLARFDVGRRCVVRGGIAELAFLDPDKICNEIVSAGFGLEYARIRVGRDPGDEDMLLAVAVRPALAHPAPEHGAPLFRGLTEYRVRTALSSQGQN
jgi:SAM-dependent methyltransferase